MAKRLGRGYGSGKGGHTAGRGQKGQKSRTKIHILFEGLKVKKSTLKRLPLLRGKGKLSANAKPIPVKINDLNKFKAGQKVNITSLVENNIVKASEAKKFGVKILSGGKLEKKLIVEVPVSKSAGEVIVKAGGKYVSN
ncbi:mitochondrial large ribosomal subunit protein uL15m [Candidatus Microgenomates bacterium]|nr:mitochondrial large ribosomal subunit protein uL15m [Candidatus Microgenomates bacterium]